MNTEPLLSAIENELKAQVGRLDDPTTKLFHDMLTYHMGWTGEGAGAVTRGKRLRPLLVLFSAQGCGGKWLRAVCAAAAVELVHNFSLVHDDIEDDSEKRHGRATVWAVWGKPNAINAGDALFVLANHAILDLSKVHPATVVTQAAEILARACLDLTRGQYLDMNYARRNDLQLDAYWAVIQGKTAALLAASCHLGALLGGADEARQETFRSFGEHLGMAFQVQDDILGIWGKENITGKSSASDLTEGKLSLPVLYGLSKKGKFAELWSQGGIPAASVDHAAELLKQEGALEYARSQAQQLTSRALDLLEAAQPDGEAGESLLELTQRLLNREQ